MLEARETARGLSKHTEILSKSSKIEMPSGDWEEELQVYIVQQTILSDRGETFATNRRRIRKPRFCKQLEMGPSNRQLRTEEVRPQIRCG